MPYRSRVASKPLSRTRSAVSVLGPLVILNALTIYDGRRRLGLFIDVGVVALFAFLIIATRIWPDKIWWRRPTD